MTDPSNWHWIKTRNNNKERRKKNQHKVSNTGKPMLLLNTMKMSSPRLQVQV